MIVSRSIRSLAKRAAVDASLACFSPAASARFHATAYDVGLVVTKSATSGQADIYVDGVLAGRISLHASRTTYRQLVFARHFATLASHTIEVRPVGNGRVDVDAFTVLR